jgi:hypothetical protein
VQDHVEDDATMYEDVDGLYAEDLLAVLDQVDVHVPVVDRAVIRAVEGGDKGEKKAAARNEKARADAAREKEREKASVAAVRAQLAGKGCAAPAPVLALRRAS